MNLDSYSKDKNRFRPNHRSTCKNLNHKPSKRQQKRIAYWHWGRHNFIRYKTLFLKEMNIYLKFTQTQNYSSSEDNTKKINK